VAQWVSPISCARSTTTITMMAMRTSDRGERLPSDRIRFGPNSYVWLVRKTGRCDRLVHIDVLCPASFNAKLGSNAVNLGLSAVMRRSLRNW